MEAVNVTCQADVHLSGFYRMEAELQQLKEDNQCFQTGVSDVKCQDAKAT